MIVNLDCNSKLSLGNRLYQVSKILGHRHLCRLVEPANIYSVYWLEKSVTFRVQLINAASIQTTLTMMKIDHIPFISF